MTLSQAFTQWAVVPRNTVLAAKSRDAVRRVLMKQWGDIDLEQFSETFARRIFRESREPLEMQVKAASVLVYVLQWGGDHGHCRRPKFTYDIASQEYHKAHEQQPAEPKPERAPMPQTLSEMQGKTHIAAAQCAAVPQQPSPAEPSSTTTSKNKSDMKQTESPAASGEAPETPNPQSETKRSRQKGPRGKAPRPVTQIDPQTLQPLQQFPTIREAAETVGCLASNIHRAVSQLRSAGGYYWCDPENSFIFADLMAHKKTTTAARRAIAATINKGRRKQVGDAKAEKAKAEKEQQPVPPMAPSPSVAEQFQQQWETMQQNVRHGLTREMAEQMERSGMPMPLTDRNKLAAYTDRELAAELSRRGWNVRLTMNVNV